ncbi:hypothetical protein O6H91_22G067200 [Diphasiastrum complanatum]|uniref:Uncharacterized protein n=1 Tax=Diphasiastrum complanatum TaxID=34168 RepID=A0ACC2AGJ5_DIPCM|nr:hypothetical protein O6H91_22G067200 [Diphasiastrum complanatum]
MHNLTQNHRASAEGQNHPTAQTHTNNCLIQLPPYLHQSAQFTDQTTRGAAAKLTHHHHSQPNHNTALPDQPNKTHHQSRKTQHTEAQIKLQPNPSHRHKTMKPRSSYNQNHHADPKP